MEQEVGFEPTLMEYQRRPHRRAFAYSATLVYWYQNLVSIQTLVVYETSMGADPSGICTAVVTV